MKHILSISLLSLSLLLTAPVAAQEIWQTSEFDWPESTLWDETREHYILSNMNGYPNAADGKGYLSKLQSDGTLINKYWVTGLDAPKGMALVGSDLIVADLGNVHVIDAQTGHIKQTISVPGATLLNDVTSNGTKAWISDWMGHGIWLYENGKVTLWYEGDDIRHPNGLLAEQDRLIIGTWGEGLKEDFSTQIPGDLKAISLQDKTVTILSKHVGNLDGVIRFKGRLLTNDWISGQIYEIDENGQARELLSFQKGLADISHDGSALLLPFMLEGKLQRYHLN
ncbi:MAG: hypothetical protein OIF58_15225 [Cohaesibacter sp.]|nr:hypothetical protein [Cohaesibacter sp.]